MWLERLDLSSRADERLDALSHGNQQRVQFIAALVNEPELLVLDEPFSGLDPLAMASMSVVLAEVATAGTTVLFSSHQLDLVEDVCEDVVIINAGRVVLAGDLAELRAEVPQRFVRMRFRGGTPDWSRSPGVKVIDQRDGEARLRVAHGVDLAALVAAAQRDTNLVAFAYEPPTLSELFRDAVAA
jgi:ABC-2 type transport system ATP-binding protein